MASITNNLGARSSSERLKDKKYPEMGGGVQDFWPTVDLDVKKEKLKQELLTLKKRAV